MKNKEVFRQKEVENRENKGLFFVQRYSLLILGVLASGCARLDKTYVEVNPVSAQKWGEYTESNIKKALERPELKVYPSQSEREELEEYLNDVYGLDFDLTGKNLAEIVVQVIQDTGDARFLIKPKNAPAKPKKFETYDKEKVRGINENLSYVNGLSSSPNTLVFLVKAFRAGEIKNPVAQILRDPSNQGKKVIFDFTQNKGGSTKEKKDLLDLFLEEGILARSLKKGNEYATDGVGEDEEINLDSPLLILTSSKTASSAERFSIIMKEHKKALVCGERTFGKWAGNLENDSIFSDFRVKTTIDRHPSSKRKELQGIKPNIPWELDESGLGVLAQLNEKNMIPWLLGIVSQAQEFDPSLVKQALRNNGFSLAEQQIVLKYIKRSL